MAEAFSMGLTMLSAAVTEDLESLYDMKSYSINEEMLKRKLDEMKTKPAYSEVLKSTISNLCKLKVEERMVPEEVWSIVENHEEKIKKK